MIIKSLSRKSGNSGQLIQYILRYALHPEKSREYLKARSDLDRTKLMVRHNLRARSLKGIVREFEKNEAFRLVKRKDSVRLFHTVLSLSSRDRANVSEDILKDLAERYVTLRGLNNLYVGACHFDKEHAHIHIVHSGTALNGRSARVSKQQFHSIKIHLEQYQQEKYPFLVNSMVEHGKSRRLAKEKIVSLMQASRQPKKETLLSDIERLMQTAASKEQFLSELQQLGHVAYYRAGRLQGVMVEGVKFRFSRLGFDTERLETLDQSNRLIHEIQELRKGTERAAYREAVLQADTPQVPEILEIPQAQALRNELADLRTRRTARGKALGREDEYERELGDYPAPFQH